MLSDGEHNLADTAADSSASVTPSEATSPLDHSATSDPTPHSPRPTVPRRAVPTTFNPIINDEANILAAITRGDRTIFDLAEEHGTTVANFAIWLQREDIQQKLSDLTSAGTTLTRVAAVNQLPKAVKAMAFQIEAHIFDRTHNLIKPGLAADRISALRDANARKACNLLLRLARFDPSRPLYSPRPTHTDRADLGEARSPGPDGGAVEQAQRRETEGALLLPSAPAPCPDLLSLCAAALSAASNVSDSEGRGRAGEPSGSSAISADQGRSGWRGNLGGVVPSAISILQNNPASRLPVETQDHKHNGHTNGRVIRHSKPLDSPPKSRPPPPD